MNKSNHEDLQDIISPDEIPFMHYGIINQYNYTKVTHVPIKRWDPLSYNPIILNESGDNVTLDKQYGHYSYISPIRGKRPKERKNTKVRKIEDSNELNNFQQLIDIFEPMVKGKHYISTDGKIYPAHTLIISEGNNPLDNPFSDQIKIYPNLKGLAFAMINKFPAMVRVIDQAIEPKIKKELYQLDSHARIAEGICFLTVPKYYHETIEDMTTEELREFFKTTQTAIKFCIEESVKKDIKIIPIAPFFNVGREVGGSLRRVHMQVYMDLTQDGHGSRLESTLKAFDYMNKTGECQLCQSKHGDGRRIILETDDWTVFATNSPIRNRHLRFAPKEHIEHIGQLQEKQFNSLAKILRIIFMVLDDLNVPASRNVIINTKPFGYKSFFHLFGDILPFEFVGGAEMADDMRVVRVSPNKFAKECQSIIKQKKYENIL
ncbi:MAG: hypothetical protein GF364_08455 [Candidatus Lokiarchaeota archaeon]|nr:hypothetical protein [Candidatus Lokiarchaeota archaeon]